MSHAKIVLALFFGIGALAAPVAMAPAAPRDRPDTRFHEQLLDIAKCYLGYGRFDDQTRWAPVACAAAPPAPAAAQFSASNDEVTHGRKLYSLLVKDPRTYPCRKGEVNPVGQVIVKESWMPEEVTIAEQDQGVIVTQTKRADGSTAVDTFLPYVTKDGKTYRASKKAALFIMMKLDPKTPGTDNGWVYGTVSADGKKVTAAGRIESCMKCHQEAKGDRLFGLDNRRPK